MPTLALLPALRPFSLLARTLAGAVGACLLLAAVQVQAASPGLRIESFKVLSADAVSAQIDFVATRSDAHTPMLVGVYAKSRDGTGYTGVFRPALVPEGKKVRFTAEVMRPGGTGAMQTEYLWVFAYEGGEVPFMRTRLAWAHAWPADTAPEAARRAQALQAGQAGQGGQTPMAIFDRNLVDEDFGALDTLLAEWNTPAERDANGDWKLDGFRVALSITPDMTGWDEHLARIRRWKKFNPRSAGAAIAEARHWADYAWHIRDCRCGGREVVDPVALRVFHERMKRAEQALLASKRYAADNPLWYATYLDVAAGTDRSEAFVRKLFEEAVARHPLYQPLYTSMAMYWVPRDGRRADWDQVEVLAERAVGLTRATDGDDNYAWLYASVSDRQRLEVDVMRDSALSWPRMRRSFEALVTRYPSPDNLNTFAAFACRAGDKATYLNLSVKIGDQVVPRLWPDNHSIDMCNHRFMQHS